MLVTLIKTRRAFTRAHIADKCKASPPCTEWVDEVCIPKIRLPLRQAIRLFIHEKKKCPISCHWWIFVYRILFRVMVQNKLHEFFHFIKFQPFAEIRAVCTKSFGKVVYQSMQNLWKGLNILWAAGAISRPSRTMRRHADRNTQWPSANKMTSLSMHQTAWPSNLPDPKPVDYSIWDAGILLVAPGLWPSETSPITVAGTWSAKNYQRSYWPVI